MQNEFLNQLQGLGVHLGRLPTRLHQVTDVDVQVVQQLLGGTQHIARQQRLTYVPHLYLMDPQIEFDKLCAPVERTSMTFVIRVISIHSSSSSIFENDHGQRVLILECEPMHGYRLVLRFQVSCVHHVLSDIGDSRQ